MVKSRQGSGGPKTQLGKLQSAKNSVKHGLTSLVPNSENEVALVESFTKELVDYYQPSSPLEQLQITRIAICRAKLAHLYSLEQVKLELALTELKNQPDKVFARIPQIGPLTKTMIMGILEGTELALPCGLTSQILSSIASEIDGLQDVVQNRHAFARGYPVLAKYLMSFPITQLNDASQLLEKLSAIAKRISTVLSREDVYSPEFESLFHYYALGKKYEGKLEREKNKDGLDELDAYQEIARQRNGMKAKPPQVENKSAFNEEEYLSSEQFRSDLKVFTTLHHHEQEAYQFKEQFLEVQALMLRSVTLPTAESDLLMRYQTTLERRLSSAIGELLELQKRSQ